MFILSDLPMAKNFETFKTEYQSIRSKITSYEREFENKMETALTQETASCSPKLKEALSTLDRLNILRGELYHLVQNGFDAS